MEIWKKPKNPQLLLANSQMQLNTYFTSLALTVTFSVFAKADTMATFNAVFASVDTIVAFSNNDCDGAMGATVQCDGSCHQFAGRHSLKVIFRKNIKLQKGFSFNDAHLLTTRSTVEVAPIVSHTLRTTAAVSL